ncbi:MAG: hypothetical protein RL141_388 [Candidatus Parcubacteria bacterium]
MDRDTQTALKIILSFGISLSIGSGFDIWFPFAAGTPIPLGEFLWSFARVLGETAVLYLFFSIIFAILNGMNRSAKHSPFQPIIFRSPSSFWKWWAGSILFIPFWWVVLFTIFFSASGDDALFANLLLLIAPIPLAFTLIITLINAPAYIRHRRKKD